MNADLSLPRGRLRPARADDLDVLLKLLHDKDVRRYLCDDTALPRETVAGMLGRSEQLASRGLGLWMIENSSGDVVGVAGLQPVSEEVGTAPTMAGGIEPVIAVNPVSWGRGLAREAMSALIRYARDELGLSQLVAAVDEPNTRSHRLMDHCGFVPIGRTQGPAYELVLYRVQLGDGDRSLVPQ